MKRPDPNSNEYISEGTSFRNEFLYRKALEEYIEYLEDRLYRSEPHLSQGNNDFPQHNAYVTPWESMGQ